MDQFLTNLTSSQLTSRAAKIVPEVPTSDRKGDRSKDRIDWDRSFNNDGENTGLLDEEEHPEKLEVVSKPWECFANRKKACYSWCLKNKAWLLKFSRLIMLIGLMIFAIVSGYIYLRKTTVNEDYTFSGDELILDVSACRIWFKKGTESDVTVHVSSQTRASYLNSTQPDHEYFYQNETYLKMHNPNEDVDAWDIELKSARFPNLYIKCDEWQCPITQKDEDEELNFSEILDIKHLGNEADGNVYFKRIDVGELDMNITGTLVIEELTTAVGGKINTKDGDIWIQSQQESNVRWTTRASSAYQFVGPEADHITAPVCDSINITQSNSTFEVNNCEGNSVVCSNPGCAGDFSLDLSATDGGIYVQLLESPGKLYSTKSVSWRDDESLISHTVDLLSKIKIQNVRDELQGDVVQDQFFIITMAGINYDIGRWLFTTKEAYSQLKPWWMSLISFGALLPEPKYADLRLVPWPIIQSEPFDVDHLVLMGNIWNIIYGEFGSDPDQLLLWMDGSHSDEDNWYKYTQDKFNEYDRELQELSDNKALLAAIWLSSVVGFVGAIAGVIGAWYYIKKYNQYFWKNFQHKRRYKQILPHITTRKPEKIDPTFVAKKTQIPDLSEEKAVRCCTKAGDEYPLPSPFAFIDSIIKTYQKAWQGSLEVFLKAVKRPASENQPSLPVYRVKAFKEAYESYCFAHDYKEEVIVTEKNKTVFLGQGFELSTESNSTTEAFKNIRKKTKQEKDEEPGVTQIPGEDSLTFFVRSQYKKTVFENDIEFQVDFELAYKAFCKQKKRAREITKEVPLTKRAMVSMGFDYERLTVNIIRSTNGTDLDLEIAHNAMNQPILEPMTSSWYFWDIAAIMWHCALIWILVFPILAVTFSWQHLHSTMSTRPVDQFITLQDISYRPWLIWEKLGNLEEWIYVPLLISVVILVLSFLELIVYYTTRGITFQLEKILLKRNWCHQCLIITSQIFYGLIYFVAALCCGYALLGVQWCILGSVLNPEVFLPYTAGAVTFLSFAIFKIKNAVNNWRSILRELQLILIGRMNEILHDMLDKVILQIKFDGAAEIAEEVGTMSAALASGRYVHALQKRGLGDILETMGMLNPELILAIAHGDSSSIGMIAEKFGVDEVIVEALSAAVTKDLNALYECIPKLSAHPGIDIDPEVAKSFVMLAARVKEVNLRTSVKTAVIQFTKVMNNKLSLGMPIERLDEPSHSAGYTCFIQRFEQFTGNFLAGMIPGAAQPTPTPAQQASHAQTSPNQIGQQSATGAVPQIKINPRVIEALVDMASDGDLTRLREILFEFEEKKYLPTHTCKIFDLLKCVNAHDHDFIKDIRKLLHHFCTPLDKKFTKGLGCLVSQRYHGYVQQTKVRKGNFEATWPEIDDFCEIIGIPDESIIVKVMMCMTRGSKNTLQRFIPKLVKYLKSRLGWTLKTEHLCSLFTMVYGVRLNIDKLSVRWDLDVSEVRFFSKIMSCPYEKRNLIQRLGEPMSQAMWRYFIGHTAMQQTLSKQYPSRPSTSKIHPNPSDMLEQAPKPIIGKQTENTVTDDNLMGLENPYNSAQETENADVALLEQRPELQAEEEKENTGTDANLTGLDNPEQQAEEENATRDETAVNISNPEQSEDQVREQEQGSMSPSFWLLEHQMDVDATSMTWLANKFNLAKEIVMGIFITIRRANREHNVYVEPLIRDFLRKKGVDSSKYLKIYMDIFNLIVSVDQETISEAHRNLNLQFVELALISNHVKNPKDLRPGYLTTNFGLEETDTLVKTSQKLIWYKNPVQCDKWCKALYIKIGKGQGLQGQSRLFAQSLLQMSVKAPTLLIKKLLQKNWQADDDDIYDFKTLISANYIKKMQLDSKTRKTVIQDLSRLYEIPKKSLKAFIGVSLADCQDQRRKAMLDLLDSFSADNLVKKKITRVVEDAQSQLDQINQNVENFANLGDLFGLPPKFIESISPGIINAMSQDTTRRKQFVEKFAQEFQVKNKELQKSISAFVVNECSGVEQLGQVFGLKKDALTSVVKILGVSNPEESIKEISQVLQSKYKANKNVVKAFFGLIAGFTKPIPSEKDEVNNDETAPQMLETQLNISKHIWVGIMSSIQREEAKVKSSIFKLCQLSRGKFDMDDQLCRGFLSITTGTIEGIEDICNIINYSADIAEVLVMLANQYRMNDSSILENQLFSSLCVRLGLKAPAMAAMLALTQQDIDNSNKICEDLGSEKQFPPLFIKALMAVYKFSTINGDQHEKYNQQQKKQMMLDNIKPLAMLVDIKDPVVASFIVGLAQGNAGVIEDMFERFGWNGQQRITYGAFCYLFHQFPFAVDDKDFCLSDFVSDKELFQVCSVIGTCFKLNPEGIEKIVLCAREDPQTLQWLMHHLPLTGLTEAKNFVKIATNDGEIGSEDDDIQEYESDEEIELGEEHAKDEAHTKYIDLLNQDGEQEDAQSLSDVSEDGNAVMEGIIAGDGNKDEFKQNFDKKFETLLGLLNKDYPQGKADKQEFTLENVKLIMYLAAGKFGKFDTLQEQLQQIYGDIPPVDATVIQELLSITSGKYENVAKVFKELPEYEKLQIASTSNSIFYRLGLNHLQLEFLMKLASRNIDWLDIEYERGQKISQKIMPHPRLAKAVFALWSLEPMAVQAWVPELSKYLDLDSDMAQILVLLSNQALNRAPQGIAPLAERLEMDTNITNSFCCMAYSDQQLRMDAIKILCDRIELINQQTLHGIRWDSDSRTYQVMAIFKILAGDFYVGWDMLAKLLYFPVISAEEHEDRTVTVEQKKLEEYEKKTEIVQYFLQILARRWDVKQDLHDFETGELDRFRRLGTSLILQSLSSSNRKSTLRSVLGQPKQKSTRTIISLTMVNSTTAKTVFGQEQIKARQRIAEDLGFIHHPDLVDLIIGIAQNKRSIVKSTVKLLNPNLKNIDLDLVEELLHLYNANDSEIPQATDYIEDYIAKINRQNMQNEDNFIPHGLLQAIYGSVRKFNEVMAKGVSKGLASNCFDLESSIPNEFQQAVPLILVFAGQPQSSGQPQSCKNYLSEDIWRNAQSFVFDKLLSASPSNEQIDIFQALIQSDLTTFLDRLYALDPTTHRDEFKLINEIHNLVKPGHRMDSLTHITNVIMGKYKLSKEFTNAMILVLSDSHGPESAEPRPPPTGMDDELQQLISFFVDKLAGKVKSTLANQLFQQIEGKPAIMKILDACFLAFKDPQANTKQVLSILPVVARALLGNEIPEKAIKLISGIIKLIKAEEEQELKHDAIVDLATSFDIDTHLVKGFLALAKGEWKEMKEMIARIWEFDETTIDRIVQLIRELRKARAADTTEEKTKQKKDVYEQLQQRIPDGTDVEAVFDMLDTNADGTLSFTEFQEAFKYYNLPMSEQRQLEMFARYDTDGQPDQLGLKDFVRIMAYIRRQVCQQSMDELGLSRRTSIAWILIAIIILGILFVFIYLGISSFTNNSTLGSVVNSLLPMMSGLLLNRGLYTDITEVTKRIKDSVEQRLSVLTMSDV